MDTLSYKTISANSSTVEKQWVIVDAQSAILGRLASEVAKILGAAQGDCRRLRALGRA